MAPVSPFGRRLLPTLLDQIAAASPDRVYGRYPPANWHSKGYREITWSQFAKAVDKASYWLDASLGPAENFDTFAYSGSNDFRYAFLVLAAIKTGRKILIPDGRISGEGRLNLLDKMCCYSWLSSANNLSEVESLPREKPGLKLFTVPSFEFWLDVKGVKHYAYNKTFEEAKDDPLFVIHTSGTTGQPKPIVQTTSMASTLDIYTTLSKNGEMLTHDHMRGAQYLTTAPLCWVAGLVSIIHTPIFWDTVPVLLPDDAPMPLDVDLVKRVHRAVDFDGGFYPPSLLRDICEDAEALEHIKKLKFVMYAGAPLDEWVGDLLCKSVHVLPLIGSTEVGMLPLIQPKVDEDWKYYHFHPASGYRMEPRRDLFELIIDRKSELEPFQSVFKVFPELQTFSTKDLYRPHSEKPNLWKYEGRGDDLVKLSWLAKFHAKDIESAIERHPKVLSALMGGDDRPKPFLLVELKSREETSDLEDIWQELKAINKKNTEEIRIAKEMVLIADPHRSFRRSLKRTLDRKAILADYQKDIDMLYLCFNGEH